MATRRNIPTDIIAKTLLSFVLQLKYKNLVSVSPEYISYNGENLPSLSGFDLINSLATYIDHGGDKTEAIEKFIDKHLRSENQLEELLIFIKECIGKHLLNEADEETFRMNNVRPATEAEYFTPIRRQGILNLTKPNFFV